MFSLQYNKLTKIAKKEQFYELINNSTILHEIESDDVVNYFRSTHFF